MAQNTVPLTSGNGSMIAESRPSLRIHSRSVRT